jgi:very-short-patch-repair endonuclease
MKINYNPELKKLARQLRNNSTKAEIKFWTYLKGRQLMGYDFHRQKPTHPFFPSNKRGQGCVLWIFSAAS